MHIKTKETVQKTLSQYRWDDVASWHHTGTGKECTFSRPVYQKGDLTVTQKKWYDGFGVEVTTPDYTMYITSGHRLSSFYQDKSVQYYSLSVATTQNETKVYQAAMDEEGFADIHGDRRYLFRFMENLPDKYFTLDVDEKAKHISTYWMKPRCLPLRSKQRIVEMGREG